jgi:N6-adenosine-specific RNA methylase IME4
VEIHPAAGIFPDLSNDEIRALAMDIAHRGQIEPIVTHEGKILDGRHRFRACEMAGIKPRFVEWDGRGGDPWLFVASMNLHRRHLTTSQRAMCAERLKAGYEDEAKARQGTRTDISANWREGEGRKASEDAARALNVSPRSVERATRVMRDGTPELVQAVDDGKVAVSAASEIATLPHEEQDTIVASGEAEIIAKAKEIRQRRQAERRKTRVEKVAAMAEPAPELPAGRRFPVLLVDPPWRYRHTESDSRAVENHYPTMTHEELRALDVAGLATDDAVLFMWTTSPKVAEAVDLLRAWRFDYKTQAVWDKGRIGPGYYFRQQHEILLVATRGSLPTPEPSTRPPSVIKAPRAEHSAKPDKVYAMIESMYPEHPRLELFARQAREGWEVWGNEC